MTIVGSTYKEKCHYPHWNELFGSGGRAVSALAELEDNITFFTYLAKEEQKILSLNPIFNESHIALNISDIEQTVSFEYFNPLSIPQIYPSLDLINQNDNIMVRDDTILRYGFLEGDAVVHGNKVVYDPQSSSNPKGFYDNGSTADELIMILNLREARLLSGYDEIEDIKNSLLNQNTIALVIKLGPSGGVIITKEQTQYYSSYKSNKVFSIGTGDVFSAIFAHFWATKNEDLLVAAEYASKAVSLYSANQQLPIKYDYFEKDFEKVIENKSETNKTIYLAGPFFNMEQRWLVEEARNNLIGRGFNIFSPFHDVGLGSAEEVVNKDIEGIHNSEVIFALLDGLDTGTIFEIGYAIALKKKVVIYVENERDEDLKMMEGTNCIIENDFTSAIYKTIWSTLES